MPGNVPDPTIQSPPARRRKGSLTRGWESLGNASAQAPELMGTPREPAGNAGRANRRMHLPLLTTLSAGRSHSVPDSEWPGLVELALAGDPTAVQRAFAAGARWANQLIHQRGWLLDPEAEVVTLMWDTLHCRPVCSDDWRTLVRRRLARREYRPSPEVATCRDVLEETVGAGEFESRVLDRLDARRRLDALGPMPPGMHPYIAAVWVDQPPPAAAAHSARQYRYLQRRAVA